MATVARPVEEMPRPNIPSANIQLPAVRSYQQVNDEIIATLTPTGAWFIGLGIAITCLLIGIGTWIYQIYMGLGVAGYNPPVMWGVYIITFVFWVGIGHAGTLISAILYLFRAGFRTTIYRCAEAMTVFAVMTAGLFPILHLGRPWKFFWLIPYPHWRLIWPNFKSPLVWDVFAILTYLTVSTTFLYVGLVPDIAALRDRETNPIRKRIYSMLSLGWRNSDREWRHFTRAYLFLAAFSTPLVLSVHSVVSFDFAMALVPVRSSPASGWCSRSSSRSGDGSGCGTTSPSTTSTPRRSCVCSPRSSWGWPTSPSSGWRGTAGTRSSSSTS
jgi:molybdopterin-containing oxidoreductase family membrane subunit